MLQYHHFTEDQSPRTINDKVSQEIFWWVPKSRPPGASPFPPRKTGNLHEPMEALWRVLLGVQGLFQEKVSEKRLCGNKLVCRYIQNGKPAEAAIYCVFLGH
ncbi:uncharacterized protein AAEQ78_016301 [Lycaon pictus]